jgi:hypothetical protein
VVHHHEDEEERASLVANSEGLIGLRDLHTKAVGDVVWEEVVGELYVGHPFAVPEVRSGYLFNGDVGIVGIEVLDFLDNFVVVRNDDRVHYAKKQMKVLMNNNCLHLTFHDDDQSFRIRLHSAFGIT